MLAMQTVQWCIATFAVLNRYYFKQALLQGGPTIKGVRAMSLRNRIQKYRQYRQNLHELRLCSDRNLADLGISRADIRQIAWSACN